MIQKKVQPAHLGEGERVGTADFAEEQISRSYTLITRRPQESLISSYAIDDQLNVIRVQFGPRHSEVRS